MATLNLNEKKIPSTENLRLLSSLILSLSSKQGAIENKLINNWVASTAYIKDESFVIYDELLYVCKISNADDTFDKNKWTCLSPVIEELTKADIEALVNLTPEQITNLQSLIDDTSISTTHTNSSSHIYMAIQDAIAECKDDTLKQIAKKVSGSYKIANTTADIVSADYIYLLSNGTNYDLYILVDGTATKVGDTNIDLSEYVKTTDLADYMKTSDADGKFATITTVDGKVDKTNILTALDDAATDDQVYSAKAINTELDGVVKKTDISTTINSTSTDDTVPSTKAVYNTTSKFLKTYTSIEQLGLTNGSETIEDIANSMEGFTRLIAFIERPNISIYPHYNGTLIVEKLNPYRVHFKFCIDELPVVYVGTYHAISGFSGWKRLCATSVADVPSTQVNYNVSDIKSGRITYEVINGVCYVNITALVPARVGLAVEINQTSMPKPRTGLVTCSINNDATNERIGLFYIETAFNNYPRVHIYSMDKTGYATFSYPVAES